MQDATSSGRLSPEQLREMLECAALDVRRTMRAVTQLYDHVLAQSGLRSTQLPILVEVSLQPGAAVKDLAARLFLEPSSMLRNLRALQARGLLDLKPGKHDRRVRTVWITDLGTEQIEAARTPWRQVQYTVIDRLGPEWELIQRSLESLRRTASDLNTPQD